MSKWVNKYYSLTNVQNEAAARGMWASDRERQRQRQKVYYVILRQCKRKTIYVTILIGCHTKCFNVIFVRATQNHPRTLARSLTSSTIYYARFVFLSLSYVFFLVSFLFVWLWLCRCRCRYRCCCCCCFCLGASVKELLLGFVRLFCPTPKESPALITVNNFNRYNNICNVLSFGLLEMWMWVCPCVSMNFIKVYFTAWTDDWLPDWFFFVGVCVVFMRHLFNNGHVYSMQSVQVSSNERTYGSVDASLMAIK